MDAKTWQAVKVWLADLAELSDRERAAYLARHCPDPAVRDEVLAMLAAPASISKVLKTAALAPGTRVGPYEIVEPIGAGGMGEVYRARDLTLRRDVAIKVLPVLFAENHDRLARFEREARVLASLNHPNIAQIYGVVESGGQRALVMELVEGRTLRELIHGRPGVDALKQVALQTARAIAAAHASGILHRDIKPDNVMVRTDGYVKVLDFGLARAMPAFDATATTEPDSGAVAAVTGVGDVLGTTAYLSPERARGGQAGAASDVFALGVVFYELLTGHHPFESAGALTMIARMLSDEPEPPSRRATGAPPGLDALILLMLDKDPRQRPTAADVDARLSGIFEGSGRPSSSSVAVSVRHTVGRDLALAEMRRAFECAAAGQGAVVALSGEPGIGKTTLAEEFLDLLGTGGQCYIGRGRCSERHAGTGAYLPWLEALDGLHDRRRATVSRLMKTVAPTWYALVAPPDPGETAEARALTISRAGSQEWMKRELYAFLEALARDRPVVLFFDDLQWADESTVDIFAYVSDRLRAQRILVIAAYRLSDLRLGRGAFLPLQLALDARGICRSVPLDFLTPGDVERYVDLEFPGHRFPPSFAGLVHAKTEGNPLFMADLLRSFRDRGVITFVDGTWTIAQLTAEFEHDIPASIRSLIELQITRLDEADRRLLTVASVAGAEFTSAVVARALEIEHADVEDRLRELARTHALVRLVHEEELPDRSLSTRYRFFHVLYQNALYASLGPQRRASVSLKVAEALLAVYGERSKTLALELGSLFEASRDFSRAADFFLAASVRSRQVYADREALALAEHAMSLLLLLPDTPERAPRELTHLMGVVLPTSGLRGFAAQELDGMFERIQQLCERLGDHPLLFVAVGGSATVQFMRAELSLAAEAIDPLQRLSEMTGDPVIAIYTEFFYGTTHSHFGRGLEDAMRHLDRGAQLSNPATHPRFMLTIGFDGGLACGFQAARVAWMLGRPDVAASRIESVVAEARRCGHPMMIAWCLFFQAWIRQHARDPEGVLEVMRELRPLIDQYGYPHLGGWSGVVKGWAEALTGHAADGEATIRQSLALLDGIGIRLMRPNFLALLAEAIAAQGRIDEALGVLDEAAAIAERTEERCYLAEIHRLAGEWLAAKGPASDLEHAKRRLELAVAIADEQGAPGFGQRAAASLARIAAR